MAPVEALRLLALVLRVLGGDALLEELVEGDGEAPERIEHAHVSSPPPAPAPGGRWPWP